MIKSRRNPPNFSECVSADDELSFCRGGNYATVACPQHACTICCMGAALTEACNTMIKGLLRPQQHNVGCDHGPRVLGGIVTGQSKFWLTIQVSCLSGYDAISPYSGIPTHLQHRQ